MTACGWVASGPSCGGGKAGEPGLAVEGPAEGGCWEGGCSFISLAMEVSMSASVG